MHETDYEAQLLVKTLDTACAYQPYWHAACQCEPV